MRIVIAEDDPLLREGVVLLLCAESLGVVAAAGTPDAALEAIDLHTGALEPSSKAATHLDAARHDLLAFTAYPHEITPPDVTAPQ
ncbi:hypothetical protein GCM10009753_05080 [Streptantibioticus ferralitis]